MDVTAKSVFLTSVARAIGRGIIEGLLSRGAKQDLQTIRGDMDVSGKSVFLTGGARGIGRGIMEGLLSRRAKVRAQPSSVLTRQSSGTLTAQLEQRSTQNTARPVH
ncbi:hypothetical protein BaRGS_00037666 [Batillaria attramentaria]|uniref:Ketoreductase (KR) domain-containing protein n=1 Tax=Batillaria attramentaria TaxID=370345 RepID=A0ABD0J9D0_9CAEN